MRNSNWFYGCEKKDRKYVRDVKIIPWKLQHRLVVVDLHKKTLKKIVRKKRITRRKKRKLNENQTRVEFEKEQMTWMYSCVSFVENYQERICKCMWRSVWKEEM